MNELNRFPGKFRFYQNHVLLIITLLLAACSPGSADQAIAGLGGTITPTATLDPSGYQAVDPRACKINEWNTIQSEQRRAGTVQWQAGSLLAWRAGQPRGSWELAYISPSDRSSWFTGELFLVHGEQLQERIELAPGVLAAGDLSWSPDGERLAFLAFRPNENLYTVMVVNADGSRLVDLFPTDLARTDSRTSQKAVIGWKDAATVKVMASCGEECRSAFDMNVTEPPKMVLTPTPVQDFMELRDNLNIQQPLLLLTPTPNLYPKNMRGANWSPDENQVAYLDRRGLLWILSEDDRVNYIVDIGLRDVYETQWSEAGDALAIRAEDRVYVFQVPCR